MSENFIASLPPKFTRTITSAFREDGISWLENLPRIISEIEEKWRVKLEAPFPNLSYHFVAPGRSAENGEVVVKIGIPAEAQNILFERDILRDLDGSAVNRLLDFDEDRFAFLLERLKPGRNLKEVCEGNDEQAVEIAIGVMRDFWRRPPLPYDFYPLDYWFNGLLKAERTEFDELTADKALDIFYDGVGMSAEKLLLHGDFHHENILSARRTPFLAIDPKGIVGLNAYDIAVFLNNHAKWLINEPKLFEKIALALDEFSGAFHIKPQFLRRWCFAYAVLSAWWTFEENNENWRRELEFAKIWEV